nr:DegT/DnrJ/EryC1/StrS aminotransferase family protein [Devosia sp. JXJ CY 41]
MLNTTMAPWPSYSDEEISAVTATLRSGRVNYWTGDVTRRFEEAFAQWAGADHAVALANGTLALDVALKALGIGPGDEVIVTPRTFIASVSTVVNAGATPVFADVDEHTQGLSAATIRAVLSERTRAVICVHLGGTPCDMDPIMELSAERGFAVIEDCAQAHGAVYRGKRVGTIGHIGAWSFCQDKIMTTGGEGGMVTTNNAALWRTMWSYKDHGKDWDAVYTRQHPAGFRWLHESFGTNWRMLEMQAAIGLVQLDKMADWTTRRRQNAAMIAASLGQYDAVRVSPEAPDTLDARYRIYGFVDPNQLRTGWSRDRIIAEISGMGIPCFQGSCSEVYLEKAFDNTLWRPTQRLPIARRLGETALCFLVHPTLTDDDIARTCLAIETVLNQAFGERPA